MPHGCFPGLQGGKSEVPKPHPPVHPDEVTTVTITQVQLSHALLSIPDLQLLAKSQRQAFHLNPEPVSHGVMAYELSVLAFSVLGDVVTTITIIIIIHQLQPMQKHLQVWGQVWSLLQLISFPPYPQEPHTVDMKTEVG